MNRLPVRLRSRRRTAPSAPLVLAVSLVASALGGLAPRGASAQATATGAPPSGARNAPPEVGPFDFGKMWTFENPPAEHFSSTYGFDASPEWFERARMAALRIPGCSASFVSPNGLVVTNHHCARGAIASVTREGENLLDDGFHAEALGDERRIPGYYADQLVAALDVTDQVDAALAGVGAAERGAAREAVLGVLRSRLQEEYGADMLVQFVPLYNGARTSAYVIRRFTDVRLVAAVELGLGFFGGDPDNFTYPRYALDYAFYRVYDEEGEPFATDHWFRWGDGAAPGEPIFLVGNPGPTNRLLTVAQLEYQRDHLVPGRRAYFESRLGALRDAYTADPERGEALGLRNQAFSLSNSLKAYTGRLEALRDPQIMARKRAAELKLLDDLAGDAETRARAEALLAEVAAVQEKKSALGDEMNAYYRVADQAFGSRALLRAARALELQAMADGGAPADTLQAAREALAAIDDHPGDLEEDLLALRLADLVRYLGRDDPLVAGILEGRSPEGAATVLLQGSVLATRARTRGALEAGGMAGEAVVPADDPLMVFIRALLPRVLRHDSEAREAARPEGDLNAELGRIRFQVYGTAIAPDASSSPRITDGVVRGYEYNGTEAPTHTTLFGVYDRYFSHLGTSREWLLPERWLPVPAGLDLTTPLNFVSTADSYGGNSGSPALTRELELVGLNFDRNVEGLSRDFIYLPERGRNIMVDVRAIRHTLEVVYGAERIVREIDAARGARAGS
ncbi:MAG: S46 family peptidase [Longimicrobiales bacterium]|nr:S46 family peptidase [Longimicrobiales bacterium]